MRTFYEFALLNEISTKQLEKITKKLDRYNRKRFGDFDDIFGNKLRIVIPLQTGTQHYDISDAVKKLGYDIDFEQGTAKSITQTQQGPKIRQERLGSLLTKLHKKDPESGWDQWLDWWQKKGNKIDATSPMSIIISRSPLDVIRMSDHRDIASCHSPPNSSNISRWKQGTWHKCARQEALTGGAIAYAVRTEDLQDVPNLQAPEIFKDRDRDVEGIQPLERVRLRKFSDGETNILVPEDSTYGIRHTGFLKNVVSWARHVQSDAISKSPDFRDFELHGGSYQDSSAGELWSQFFNVNVTGNKKSVNAKDEDLVNIDEDEVKALIDGHNFAHAYVYTQLEPLGDGAKDHEVYLDVRPGISFVFQESMFVKIPTHKDLRRSYEETLGKDLEDTLFEFEEIQVHQYGGKVHFGVDFESKAFTGPDVLHDLESELDDLDTIEKKYNQYYANFFLALQNHGFINVQNLDLQHFKQKDDDEGKYYSDFIWIGNAAEFKRSGFFQSHVKVPNEISQHATAIFPFPGVVKPGDVILHNGFRQLRGDFTHLYLQLSITPNFENYSQFVKTIQHIDNNWDHYTQRAVKWFESMKSQYDAHKSELDLYNVDDEIRQRNRPPGPGDVPPVFTPTKIPLQPPRTPKPTAVQTMLNFKDWVLNKTL